jgi:hypothetical protein
MYNDGVIPKLLGKLAPEFEGMMDVHANTARCLVDIIQKSPATHNSWLLTHMQSQPMVEVLFRHMFSGVSRPRALPQTLHPALTCMRSPRHRKCTA